MSPLVERWCDLSPAFRIGTWVVMLLITGSLWRFSLPAVEMTLPPTGLQEQWHKLLPLRVDNNAPQPQSVKPFSAMAFQSGGIAVMSWQPVSVGGELVLDLQWETLLHVFPLLAERNMKIMGFSILPEQHNLQLTLQLESIRDE